MKTIKKQRLIFAWKWDTCDHSLLTEEQMELLEEHAEERAIRMYTQHGCFSGELAYEDDDISVRGWWDVSKEIELRPKTGAESVDYWRKNGVIGSRPDIADSQAYARELRAEAENRNNTSED